MDGRLAWEPRLAEAVVLGEVQRRLEGGDRGLYLAYHAEADQLYERYPAEAREEVFEQLHRRLFLKLGLGSPIEQAIEEYPGITPQVAGALIACAGGPHEEGADLVQGKADAPAAPPRLALTLCPERFLDPSELRRYLRHELMHVADMLDPGFGYRREDLSGGSPAEENILRLRYRTLWDVTIDGRLEHADHGCPGRREEREQEFTAVFHRLPPEQREALFSRLWAGEDVSHLLLLETARGDLPVTDRLGSGAGAAAAAPRTRALLPGSLCPLCRFPSHEFVERFDHLAPALIELIRQDFPGWSPDQGACERCVELYQVRAGCW